MKSILDKSFVYTPSHETDIGKRFKKIFAEQKKAAAKPTNVAPLKKVSR